MPPRRSSNATSHSPRRRIPAAEGWTRRLSGAVALRPFQNGLVAHLPATSHTIGRVEHDLVVVNTGVVAVRLLVGFGACFLIGTMSVRADLLPVYVGTYTQGDSKGIYRATFDTQSGKLTSPELVAEADNPSFLAIHPSGKYLYAVNEMTEVHGPNMGGLSAYAIQAGTGKLTLLNQEPVGGTLPCHVNVDADGKFVLLANYGSGSIAAFALAPDGSLAQRTAFVQHKGSSVTPRQQGPHAHSINLDAANRYAVVADLGTDELLTYRFDAQSGTLAPHAKTKLAKGAGPRHFAFHPQGNYAYVINELNSTVTALRYDARAGALTTIHSIATVPQEYTGGLSTAEIRISPDGRFVYGSNRGHDSIAVFRTSLDGSLTLVEIEPIGGRTPRNFELDPSGKFLLAAGQGSNNINVFRVDPQSGGLQRTEFTVDVPSPVCIRFLEP